MQGFQILNLLALLQRVHSCGQHCPAGALPGDSQSHKKTNTNLEHQEAWVWKSQVGFQNWILKKGIQVAPDPDRVATAMGYEVSGEGPPDTQSRDASLEGSLNLLCQEKSIHLIDLASSTASLGHGAAAGDAECWPTKAHISLLLWLCQHLHTELRLHAAWTSQNYLGHILLEMILLLLQQAATLLRLANSIFPILSDFFLMKLNNSFICYVISFPSGSSKTNSVES